MRYAAGIIVSLLLILLPFRSAAASCGERTDFLFEDSAGTHQCEGLNDFVKRVRWRIVWQDSYAQEVDVLDSGVSRYYTEILPHCEPCYPSFETP